MVLAELILTAALSGLIWTVQLISYPQLAQVGAQDYSAFHLHHIRAITPLVVPLMILEFIFCLFNLYQKNVPAMVSWGSLLLLVLIWGCTFFVSVPLHEKMVIAKNDELINKLVFTNWIRTFGWSLKLVMMFFVLKR